jgi:hypothetical protein
MWLCLLQRSHNGLKTRFLVLIVVLTIWDVDQNVIMPPMVILLRHGEVPCCVVLISRRSSSFSNLPPARSPLEHSTTFLSSY